LVSLAIHQHLRVQRLREGSEIAERTTKGVRWTVDARPTCDAFMERVHPPDDVTFEPDTVGESSSATWGAGEKQI
jgi:hypothetical protein